VVTTIAMSLAILVVPPFSTLCNAAFALRREVFVWEQHVPEEIEHDADDMTATHFVAICEGEVVGTLRLVDYPEHVKIGRVAVRHHFRGRGIARQMIEAAMAHSRQHGRERFYLTAQLDALGLYQRLGFVAFGARFMDAGIPHLAMRTYDTENAFISD
jgi:predicted GNAT family N-acyltransferase